MVYPRNPDAQAAVVADWNRRVQAAGQPPKPVMQPLYVDLMEDPDAPPTPLHLGVRLGVRPLAGLLKAFEQAGIHHVALNLRFNRLNIEATLERLATDILPEFPLSEA